MINRSGDILCRVLYCKYGRNKDPQVTIGFQSNDSPLWEALTSIWDQFHQHIVASQRWS
jgi:hypothetical protein